MAAREELNRRGERKRDENVMINGIIEERERKRYLEFGGYRHRQVEDKKWVMPRGTVVRFGFGLTRTV